CPPHTPPSQLVQRDIATNHTERRRRDRAHTPLPSLRAFVDWLSVTGYLLLATFRIPAPLRLFVSLSLRLCKPLRRLVAPSLRRYILIQSPSWRGDFFLHWASSFWRLPWHLPTAASRARRPIPRRQPFPFSGR